MTTHISYDSKCKLNSATCKSSQKQNNNTCKCEWHECKNYRKCKNDHSLNPGTCICENSKYLKNISNDSNIVNVEIISGMNIVSTKMTNTIALNVTKNYYSKKVRD